MIAMVYLTLLEVLVSTTSGSFMRISFLFSMFLIEKKEEASTELKKEIQENTQNISTNTDIIDTHTDRIIELSQELEEYKNKTLRLEKELQEIKNDKK